MPVPATSSATDFQLVSSAPVAYTATLRWKEYRAPTHHATTITRHLTLHAAPGATAGEGVLELRTSGLQMRKQENRRAVDPEPVEAWAQRLAALYAWVQVRTAATGEWLEVRNHAHIAQAWAALRPELLAGSPPAEPLLARLLAAVDRQVADPQAVLHSLRYDYLYQVLAGGWPAPPPGDAWSAGQPRRFAAFLPGTDLHFSEQVRAQPAAPGCRELAVRGTLDPTRTDLAAQPLPAGPAGHPPHAHYEARVSLDAATAWPAHVALTVYVRVEHVYNKQYTLTLARV